MRNLLILLFIFGRYHPLTASSDPPCLMIKGKWVTAGDLTTRIPEFANIGPGIRILAAPMPSIRRFVSNGNLELLAQKHNVGPLQKVQSICLEQATIDIPRDAILQTLEESFKGLDDSKKGTLELLNYYPKRAPEGTIQFQRNGLQTACITGACGTFRWRGSMQLAGGGSLPLTAEVRLMMDETAPVALRNLAVGTKIGPHDFILSEKRIFWHPKTTSPVGILVGQIVCKLVKSGDVISAQSVRMAREVEIGESIELQVHSGNLLLVTQAIAETGGRTGSTVIVSNPNNKKKFAAKVIGQAKAETASQGDMN